MQNNIYHKIHNKIINSRNILIVAHEKPDIDTTASICALKEYINNQNIPSTLFCHDPIPSQFKYLLGENQAIRKNNLVFDNFDTIITCDCGSLKKTGLINEIHNRSNSQTIINFDHHPKVDNYSDLEIKDSSKCATCEIIHNFLKSNEITINKTIANCLLSGIISDSNNFTHSQANSNTLKIASNLLDKGADWSQIIKQIRNNKSVDAVKVWGETLHGIELNKKYNIVSTNINLKTLNSIDEENLEGLPSLLSTIKNINGVILLREYEANKIRGSLRSTSNNINMSLLANVIGGGGHIKAAGFQTKGRLVKLEKRWAIVDNPV